MAKKLPERIDLDVLLEDMKQVGVNTEYVNIFTDYNNLPSDTRPAKSAKASKPKPPAAPEGVASVKNRISYYGNAYPKSVEGDWKEYPGVGWIHRDEEGAFHSSYDKCSISHKWYRTSSLATDSLDNIINPYRAVEAGWTQCPLSSLYINPKDIGEALDGSGELSPVSRRWLEKYNGLQKCDLSGKLYIPGSLIAITASDKYKQVARHLIVSDHETIFCACHQCGNTFEIANVPERNQGAFAGQRWCDPCYVKAAKQGVILKHNDTSYPDPIYFEYKRLGCTKVDGVVCATNKPTVKKCLRLFGVEAEVEMYVPGMKKLKMDRLDMAVGLKVALGRDFVVFKEDSTLRMNGIYRDKTGPGPVYAGFEIVSAPASIEIHRDHWYKIHETVGFKQLRAWDTDTCGFHVHVSRKTLTRLQIDRVITFINHPFNHPLICKVAGRKSSEYYKYKEIPHGDVLRDGAVLPLIPRDDATRRWAINLTNADTVEFRIFRGTVNPRHIIRNIEFCDAVCDFCYPAARSLVDMCDYRNFVTFVDQNRKQWPLLAEWFALHEFIKAPKVNDKVVVERLTLQVDKVEEVEPEKVEEPMRVLAPA
jgi:hypothetical protein